MPFDLPFWRQRESQRVEDVFPLERCMKSDDRSAVFDTEFEDRPASIKLIIPDDGAGKELQTQWKKAAALSHPALVPMLAYGMTKLGNEELACAYVVTPRPDENLADALAEMPLTPAQTMDSLQPLLGVLQYLETRGLRPAALRPSDVMAYGEQIRISSDNLVEAGEGGTPAVLLSLGTLIEDMLGPGAASTPPFEEIVRACKNPKESQQAEPWTLARIEARLFPPPETKQPLAAAEEPSAKKAWFRAGIAAAGLFAIVAYFWPASPKEKTSSSTEPPTATTGSSSTPAPAPVAATGDTTKKGASAKDQSKPSPTGSRSADPVPVSSAETNTPKQAAATPTTTSLDGVTQVMPDIPRQAQRTISGRVRINVRVRVDGAGRVTEATPEPPRVSQYFTTRAIAAARAWKFPPAQGEWVLHFELTRDDIRASAGKTSP